MDLELTIYLPSPDDGPILVDPSVLIALRAQYGLDWIIDPDTATIIGMSGPT